MPKHAAMKVSFLALLLMLLITPYLTWGQSEDDDLLYVTPDDADGNGYFIHVIDLASGSITEIEHLSGRRSDTGWSPDGKFVYVVDSAADDSRFLKLFDVENGNQQTLTTHLLRDECAAPLSWSPDGRFLAFFNEQESTASLQLLDTEDHHLRTLSDPVALYSPLIWSPDGRYLSPLVRLSEGQEFATVLWDVVRDEVVTTLDNDGYSGFIWSPDSQYLAYLPQNTRAEIAVLNLASEEVRRYEGDQIGQWSSDGRYLIHYRKEESSLFQTFILDATNGEVIQLGDELASSFYHAWSPDSRYVAYETWSPHFQYFYEHEEGATAMKSLHTLDLTSETTFTLKLGGDFFRRVTWSPSGHVLAFTSGANLYGTSDHFSVVDIDSGRINEFAVAVSDMSYEEPPRWSAEGRYLPLKTEQGIRIYDHQTGQLRPVTESLDFLLSPRWSADGRYLSVYSFVESNPDIYAIDTADDLSLHNLTNTPDETETFIGWRGTGQNNSLIHCGVG